jgi:hypothetical protein
MDLGLSIIKQLGLENELATVIKYNSGNDNPYHNFAHTLAVVKNVYKLSILRGIDYSDIKLMVIAALYHDFNHTGGASSDSINISTAMEAVDKRCQATYPQKVFIKHLIACTEFPFKEQELDECQKVFRDADLMQWLEPDFIQHVLFGLNSELNGTYCLSAKTIEKMIKFMDDATFFTEEAKYIMYKKKNLPTIKKDCEFLIKIIREN